MPDRVAEIRARLDAATPGQPWVVTHETFVPPHSPVLVGNEAWQECIAHAPADIAWLLDRVEALEYVVESQRIKPLDHDPTAKRCRCIVCHRTEVAP